jgi:hypothetical protein
LHIINFINLLSYVASAVKLNRINIDPDNLASWRDALDKTIQSKLEAINAPYNSALLYRAAGNLCLVPDFSKTPIFDFRSAFNHWLTLLKFVPEAPLFPLEDFSESLDNMDSIFDFFSLKSKTTDLYIELTSKIDEELNKRYGSQSEAEKKLKRCIRAQEKGHLVISARYAQRASKLFVLGENREGALFSLRMLSFLYAELGMFWASKYASLVYALFNLNQTSDKKREYLPDALFHIFYSQFLDGSWNEALKTGGLAVRAHLVFEEDPWNLDKHTLVGDSILNILSILNYGFHNSSNSTQMAIKEYIEEYGFTTFVDEDFYNVSKIKCNEIPEDIHSGLFVDVGGTQVTRFSMYHLDWKISWKKSYHDEAINEQFVATLQIVLLQFWNKVKFFGTGKVDVYLHHGQKFLVKKSNPPGNNLRLDVTFTKRSKNHQVAPKEMLLAIPALLQEISYLPKELFEVYLNKEFYSDLKDMVQQINIGYDYREAFLEIIPEGEYPVQWEPTIKCVRATTPPLIAGELDCNKSDIIVGDKSLYECFDSNHWKNVKWRAMVWVWSPTSEFPPIIGIGCCNKEKTNHLENLFKKRFEAKDASDSVIVYIIENVMCDCKKGYTVAIGPSWIRGDESTFTEKRYCFQTFAFMWFDFSENYLSFKREFDVHKKAGTKFARLSKDEKTLMGLGGAQFMLDNIIIQDSSEVDEFHSCSIFIDVETKELIEPES